MFLYRLTANIPLHLAHLALQEAVNGNSAAVGIEGDGGEAGEEERQL